MMEPLQLVESVSDPPLESKMSRKDLKRLMRRASVRSMGSSVSLKKKVAVTIERARSLWMKADFTNCTEILEEVLEGDRDCMPAVELYGSCLYYQGFYDRAAQFAEESVTENENSFVGNLTMAQVTRAKKKDAMFWLDLAAERWDDLGKGDGRLCRGKADHYQDSFSLTLASILHLLLSATRKGKPMRDKCIDYATLAIKLDDSNVMALNTRGVAYKSSIGCLQKMIDDFSEVVRLNPRFVNGLFNRGNGFKSQGKFIEAIEDYTLCVRLNSSFLSGFVERGMCYVSTSRYDLAILDFNKVLSMEPQHVAALVGRAAACEKMMNLEQAAADLTTAISLDHRNVSAYVRRGQLYALVGQNEDALGDLTMAIVLNESHWSGRIARGLVLRELGSLEESLQDFEVAVKLRPLKGEGHFHKAALKASLGDHSSALESYSEALRLEKKSQELIANIFCYRGLSYMNLQHDESALMDYSRALEVVPGHVDTLRNRAALFMNRQLYVDAAADFKALLEKNPKNEEYRNGLNLAEGAPEIAENSVMLPTVDSGTQRSEHTSSLPEEGTHQDDPPHTVLDVGNYNGVENSTGAVHESSCDPLSELSSRIQENPTDWTLYNERAGNLVSVGKIELAMLDYAESIRLERGIKNWKAYANRGVAYKKLTDYEAALDDYSTLVMLGGEDSPCRWIGFYGRATVYRAQGFLEYAFREISLAIESNPRESKTYLLRARVLAEKGDNHPALEDLRLALQFNPGSPDSINRQIQKLEHRIERQKTKSGCSESVSRGRTWRGITR